MKFAVTIHTIDGSEFTFNDQILVPDLLTQAFDLTDSDGVTMNFNVRNVIAIEFVKEDEEIQTGLLNRDFQKKPWWRFWS